MKQFLVLIFGCFLLVSCSYFDKFSTKEIIEPVDTIIDFSKVDAFPLFPSCKDIPSREKQQVCFQMEMAKHVYAALSETPIMAIEKINDTVIVKLRVTEKGVTELTSVTMKPESKTKLQNFDSILRVSLAKLPILEPAIKRAMPVVTEFTLPIVVKNNP